MSTTRKILAGAAALVVAVLIGIAITLATVDVNTLIGPVKDRVQAATGRELKVGGGASLKYSFEPKLVLNDVSLANVPWGTAPALLSAKRLELQVALLPLLSRRFEVIELALVDPVIALETDADGRGNWDFAKRGAAAGAPASGDAASAPSVANFSITGGKLTFRDAKSGHLTRVAITKLALRARDPRSPIAAQFDGTVDDVAIAVEGTLGPLESLVQQRWPFPVALKGQVQGREAVVSTKIGKEAGTYVLNDLDLRVGPNTVAGQFSIVTGGARPKLIFGLAATTFAIADLPLAVAAPTAATAARARSGKIFAETPVDLSILRAVDADGRIAIGKLVLANGRTVDNLKVQVALAAGRLNVSEFSASAWGGALSGAATIDAAKAEAPTLNLRVNGKGLDLGAVLRELGLPREVSGGKLDVAVDLAMRGTSPHAWASSATGTVRADVGRATLTNAKIEMTIPMDRLLSAINPFRDRDPSTNLLCAVVRLPFRDGVARVDRSIGMETNKVGVLASGTLDLRNETLDFALQPKVNSGIPVDIPNLAELVRLAGPIRSPEVKVDALASIAAIASIGAALGTSGLSVLGQVLWAKVADGGATACQIAAGQKSAPAASNTAAKAGAAANPLEDVGKAVGRLFGK